MNIQQLKKIKLELAQLKRSPTGHGSSVFETLAKRLGRSKYKTGKEPTWIREREPALSPPLSIPHHSKDMPPGTARSIINALLNDCDDWDIYLQDLDDAEQEDDNSK